MPLHRVHLGSLLVVALALAGATVAPSRAFSRGEMSISWAAGDARVAPAQVTSAQRQVVAEPTQSLGTAVSRPRAADAPVRHSLFQRPPPLSSRTRGAGSSRANHRQDQAALSVLVYQDGRFRCYMGELSRLMRGHTDRARPCDFARSRADRSQLPFD